MKKLTILAIILLMFPVMVLANGEPICSEGQHYEGEYIEGYYEDGDCLEYSEKECLCWSESECIEWSGEECEEYRGSRELHCYAGRQPKCKPPWAHKWSCRSCAWHACPYWVYNDGSGGGFDGWKKGRCSEIECIEWSEPECEEWSEPACLEYEQVWVDGYWEGECVDDEVPESYCGDGTCDEGETYSSCPEDCEKPEPEPEPEEEEPKDTGGGCPPPPCFFDGTCPCYGFSEKQIEDFNIDCSIKNQEPSSDGTKEGIMKVMIEIIGKIISLYEQLLRTK